MKRILVFAVSILLFLSLAFSDSAFAHIIDNPGNTEYSQHRPDSPHNQTAGSNPDNRLVKCPDAPFDKLCSLSTAKFGTVIGLVINFILVIATVVALFYLIYGGLKWIMSEGDKSSLETARSHIVAAIIGLIIIFMAYFIINVLLGFFVGKPIQELILPELKLP